MKSFAYTTVSYSHNDITVHSTDPAVLEQLRAEISRYAPESHAQSIPQNVHTSGSLASEVNHPLPGFNHPAVEPNRMPDGTPCADTFTRLGGKAREYGWWLLRTLTAQGWEPFQTDGSGDWDNLFDSKERIHLRFESIA